jgi:hypothetical protein
VRPRNIELERHLTRLAGEGAGLGDTDAADSLSRFADSRALPGGVRLGLDPIRETGEETADGRNYLTWGIEPLWEGYCAGEPEATDRVAKYLYSLSLTVALWQSLRP